MTGGHAGARKVGRYALYGEIASGGMATVHFGRLLGPSGFARTVAIKRLHPQFAKNPEFCTMFLDEARLAARIKHPNVVPILDMIAEGGELLLVMDYVHGESLARVLRNMERDGSQRPALKIVSGVMTSVLHGLHAAHEAVDERGDPLGIVHRDVSPQNVILSAEGTARVLDFGVAKAMGRAQVTREGELKGKYAYMAPEQIKHGSRVDRRVDVFAAAIVLWEMLAVRRLFNGDSELAIIAQVTMNEIPPLKQIGVEVPPALEAVVMRGLSRDPAERFQTAREMAMALEAAVPPAPAWEVGEWLAQVAPEGITRRAREVQAIENASLSDADVPLPASHDGSVDAASMPSAMRSSQVSGIAVPHAPQSVALPRSVVILAAAVLVVALGGATVLWLDRGRAEHATGIQPVAPTSAATTASASAKPPEPTVTPAPPETTTTSTSAPVATTAATPRSTAKSAPTGAATATTTSGKTAPRAEGCSPPYTIDAKGIRRIKPECL
ncbi:serine/threonine-protein kinase [Polyangium sorediatum]|uniref:Serine/threonine-protein kinase n=1 Tax=Polyangium sorediatum TaxID=889274 RepID=A0ABT6NKK3_9BACT|nr:serine/threonine-protein kinase [Polyangium sorediatum]MDI1428849.1 serine/threonine-protein kinase [Polyangium sorediatum]